MEPQENKSLALQKAIHSHQEAEAALVDLMAGGAESRFEAMLGRIRENLAALQLESSRTDPGELV